MRLMTPSPQRILIADDDAAMRDLLIAACSDLDADVEGVADGRALMERLKQLSGQRPPIVVSDIRMPGTSGLDVLYWLKSSSIDVHVILITAFGDRRTHVRARELGAVAVLDKPFEVADLVTQVERLLHAEVGMARVT